MVFGQRVNGQDCFFEVNRSVHVVQVTSNQAFEIYTTVPVVGFAYLSASVWVRSLETGTCQGLLFSVFVRPTPVPSFMGCRELSGPGYLRNAQCGCPAFLPVL